MLRGFNPTRLHNGASSRASIPQASVVLHLQPGAVLGKTPCPGVETGKNGRPTPRTGRKTLSGKARRLEYDLAPNRTVAIIVSLPGWAFLRFALCSGTATRSRMPASDLSAGRILLYPLLGQSRIREDWQNLRGCVARHDG